MRARAQRNRRVQTLSRVASELQSRGQPLDHATTRERAQRSRRRRGQLLSKKEALRRYMSYAKMYARFAGDREEKFAWGYARSDGHMGGRNGRTNGQAETNQPTRGGYPVGYRGISRDITR